jgi:Ca2+:H+ antiporter
MNRWLYLLLLAAPAAVLTEALHMSPLVPFVLASLGIIPLAGLIGLSTEALAERLGHRIGGLLNATFGNAAEIIIGLTALAAGLPEVVRASLAGSIIGNVLLVLGSAMLIGGWRYRRQRFDPRVAGQYATMLTLVVIGMAIPSLLATIGESTRPGAAVVQGSELHQLSMGIAIILLVCFAAYIAYSVFGLRASPSDEPSSSISKARNSVNPAPAQAVETDHQQRITTAGLLAKLTVWWRTSLWLPIVGVPLDLNFSLLEVALFALVTGLYALISLDGESTWLEGLLLCAFYFILAVGTFFTPA